MGGHEVSMFKLLEVLALCIFDFFGLLCDKLSWKSRRGLYVKNSKSFSILSIACLF